ncbi:MAG TPA: hypothetical protein VNZ85_13405 [Caulobacter sp.]|nr:hypothetical protein [Caulobacter sp.]
MAKNAKGIQYWADLIERKPHASTFVRNDDDDKRIVERGVMEEWRRSLEKEFGIAITEVTQVLLDPPDFHACVNGSHRAIELAELVDKRAVTRAIRAKQGRCEPPRFEQLQWDRSRFETAIKKLVDDKQRKYEGRVNIDALIIHSAEPWLQAAQVRQWLPSLGFEVPSSIARAYLLLDYAPEEDQEHWPPFQLFGEPLQAP